jgi:WhiB family redox-sensing transcriptional regulator
MATTDSLRGLDPWQSSPTRTRRPARQAAGVAPWQALGDVEVPCRRAPELFFAESPHDLRQAKALCGHCPIRNACLAGALERGEPCGVWGGELLERGAVIGDKRPRGRPRKSDVAA